MTERWRWASEKQIRAAADELKGTIRARYPDAQFRLAKAVGDRHIWHLWTMVDTDDPDLVNDLVRERELDLLENEHVPLYVITVQPKREDRPVVNGINRARA